MVVQERNTLRDDLMRAVTLGCFGGDGFDHARREKRVEQ